MKKKGIFYKTCALTQKRHIRCRQSNNHRQNNKYMYTVQFNKKGNGNVDESQTHK